MQIFIIIILLIIILILMVTRTSSSFVVENGQGECLACPPLAIGMKYTDPANGCRTTECPDGYTTGNDPTKCNECKQGYSKTGKGESAACTPTVTECKGRQNVVDNVCKNCELPTGFIWSSATGCATTPCPPNSTPNASGTICKCDDKYVADSTGTSCKPLNCTGRTQTNMAPVSKEGPSKEGPSKEGPKGKPK